MEEVQIKTQNKVFLFFLAYMW